MIRRFVSRICLVLVCLLLLTIPEISWAQGGKDPPREWIDPDTGHRVLRLSDEPGSASLYFHQNAYTPDGEKLIITTPTGLSTINLKTRAIEKLTAKAIAEGKAPATARPNAPSGDTAADALQPARADAYPGKGAMMERRLAERRPLQLITINAKTGEVKTLLKSTDWLNHIQFSPTDPTLLMFCHEGPWHKVDRTWTIRADGTGLTQIHHRTINMEIEGHEFFSGDGKMIWYDLQTPRSEVFWLAGYNVSTGERTWYHLERSEWSVHFNVSPDGKLFAGDGGGPNSVAAPGNGQWIYLFTPVEAPNKAPDLPDSRELIKAGVFKAERLVNLSKHDYSLEPNVTFTPDMKWIVFRSNMFGPTQVFAVEIAKTK